VPTLDGFCVSPVLFLPLDPAIATLNYPVQTYRGQGRAGTDIGKMGCKQGEELGL